MNVDLKEINNFVLDVEINELLRLANSKLRKSEVLGENSPNDYRVAEDCWLYEFESPVVRIVREKIANIVSIPVSHMEQINLVRYNVGGEYKTHHDFFHPNTDYYEKCIKQGGQRTKTALIYLNDDFKGGETNFPTINKRVTPEKGKLIIWNNTDESGNLIYESLHAGLPVIEGIKYIGVIWIRQNP